MMKGKVSVKVKFLFLVIAIIGIIATSIKAADSTATFEAFNKLTESEISGTTSQFVKFEAYFEDSNGNKYDGIRENIKKNVVLKTKLSVLSEGQLEDAQIALEQYGNFSLVHNIASDKYVDRVVGNSIYFKTMEAGATKEVNINMEQSVFDDNMDTFNVNLLSRTNKLTFTANYTGKDGQIQKIKKEINFRIDWYGEIEYEHYNGFWRVESDNVFVVDQEEQKAYLICKPYVFTKVDTNPIAPDAGVVITATVPKMGNVFPDQVHVSDISPIKKKITSTSYNPEDGKLEIKMDNPLTSAGKGDVVWYDFCYQPNIVMEYPISAYEEIKATTNSITFKATAYLEGWSINEQGEKVRVQSQTKNMSTTFDLKNPKGSVLLYDVSIDDSVLSKTNSRLIYDKDIDMKVNYKVDWNLGFYLYDENIEKFIFSEKYSKANDILEGSYKEDTDHFADSNGKFYDMDEFIQYEQIRVPEITFNVLGENGKLFVYDDASGSIIKTITYDNADEILEFKPPVKHIRIETTKPVSTGNIKIELIKNIDNPKLKNKYEEDTFETFVKLYSALHGLVEYSANVQNPGKVSINGDVANVDYQEGSTLYGPSLEGQNAIFNPQILNKNTMNILFYAGDSDIDRKYTAWMNPTLYIEFPETFTKVKYNSFSVSNYNVKVKSVKSEKIGDHIVLKIKTEGIITSDSYAYLKFQSSLSNPEGKANDKIKVYGYNELCQVYQMHLDDSEDLPDIYDIDGDEITNEKTRVENVKINYPQTDDLVTKTQITDFDGKDTIVEGPEVATVVANESKGHARVNIVVSNGYSHAISNVVIVGRIPFIGNDHVINSNIDLGSTFSTTMQKTGIQIDTDNHKPEKYTVYYSTDENATKDDNNTWKETPDDWQAVKSYKIVIESEIPEETNFGFYYTVDLPEKLTYEKVSYATHAIYFKSINTSGESKTEPSPVGLKIGGQKYKLEIRDYKFKTDSLIPHATEDITDAKATFQIKGENLGENWTGDQETGNDPATYQDLYVGAVYTVHQSSITDPYIKDDTEITFRVTTDNNGDLVFEIMDEEGNTTGFVKGYELLDPDANVPTVRLDVQNKYKYNIVVENKEKNTSDHYISGSEFTVTGESQDTTGTQGTTGEDGKATEWKNKLEDKWTVKQNTVGEEYELNEDTYNVTVTRDEDGKIQATSENNLDSSHLWVENQDDFNAQPVVHIVIENERKPAEIHTEKSATTPRGTYVLAGEEITYTIKVTNDGYTAQDVVVKDPIPDGTDFVEGSIQILDADGRPIDTEVGTTHSKEELTTNGITLNMQPKETKQVVFRVTVKELPEGQKEKKISNTAEITGGTPEPEQHPKSNEIPEYKSELSVSKAVDKDQATYNDTIIYTITLDNTNGTAPVFGIVKDKAPDGTTFVNNSIEINNEVSKEYTTEQDLIDGIPVKVEAHKTATLKFSVTVKDLDNEYVIKNTANVEERQPDIEDPNEPEEQKENPKETPTKEVTTTYVEPIIISEKKAELVKADESDREYALAGDTIKYTIVIKNAGDLDKSVNIKDTIPQGTTLKGKVNVKTDSSEEQEHEGTELESGFNVNIPKQSTVTVTFTVTVDKLGKDEKTKDIQNVAIVDGNEATSNKVTVNKPDLQYSKSSDPATGENVTKGAKIKYTITLDNTTGTAESKTTVKDPLPEQVELVTGSVKEKTDGVEGEETSHEDGELTTGIDVVIPAGGKKYIEFEVTVKDLDNGTTIKNVAKVKENIPGGDPETETDTNEVTHNYVEPIIKSTKTAIIKNSDKNYVVAGDEIEYAIEVTNEGGLAKDVVVKDDIPVGTSFVPNSISVTLKDGVVDEDEREKTYELNDLTTTGITVNLQPNETKVVKFRVTVLPIEGDPKTRNIENTATVDETDHPKSTPVTQKQPDLVVTKKGNKEGAVTRGDTITYTIELSNKNGTAPTSVTVKDPLPEHTKQGTTQVKVMNGDSEEHTYTFEELTQSGITVNLDAGETKSIVFDVIVEDSEISDKIVNIAKYYEDPEDEEETQPVENEYEEPNLHSQKTAKLETKNKESRDYAVTGDTIVYTITVTNDGDKAGTALVKDNIPSETVFVPESIVVKIGDQPQDGEYDEQSLQNGISIEVPASGTATVEFRVTVSAMEGIYERAITNTAKVEYDDEPYKEDEEPTSNPIKQYASNLQVSKTNDPSTAVKVGDRITYTITLDNSQGKAPANVTVIDQAPKGTVFIKNTISIEGIQDVDGKSYTEENLKNGIDLVIPAEGIVTVKFKVRVTQAKDELENEEKIINTVTVKEKVPGQDEPTEHTDKAENTYQEPKITAIKTAKLNLKEEDDRNCAIVGDTITYTITLSNDGDLEGKVIVKDEIPEGTSFVEGSIKINGEAQEELKDEQLSEGIEVTVGPRNTATLSFDVLVEDPVGEEPEKGYIKNVARYVEKTPDPIDPDPEDPDTQPEPEPTPKEEPTKEVKTPRIHFSKEANVTLKKHENIKDNSAAKGDEITYTITVTNDGDEKATNITVKDTVPTGTKFKSVSEHGNRVEETNEITWKIEEIQPGSTATVSFVVTVDEMPEGGVINNIATVGDKPTNETKTNYVEPDISGTKTGKLELPDGESRTYAVKGDTITYTITVTNKGGVEGTAVVTDSLPEGVKIIDNSIKVLKSDNSEEKHDGNPYNETDLQNGITLVLGPDETKRIEFKVTVLALAEGETSRNIQNIAHIEDNDDPEDPGDDPQTEIIPQYTPNLQVSKTSEPSTAVKVGDEITYTINLDNTTGTAPAKVKVSDTVPTGTRFIEGSIHIYVGDEEQQQDTEKTEASLNTGFDIVIPERQSARLTFKVKVTQKGHDLVNGEKIKNVATVTETKPNEEEPTVTEPYVENEYNEPIITSEKTSTITTKDGEIRDYVFSGDEITYTITVTNSGSIDGTVIVKDEIPANTHFVASSIVVNGDERSELSDSDLQTGISVNVEASGTATVTFKVVVDEITEENRDAIKNVATIEPQNPKDVDPEEPTPKPVKPEVKNPIIKTVKKAEVIRKEKPVETNNATMGDTIKYTITVKNVSDEKATNIVIKDTVPAGTTFKKVNDSGTEGENGEITWTIPELDGGASKDVSFEVTVTSVPDENKITNIATVGGEDTNQTETEYVKPEIEVHKKSEVTTEGSKEEREYVTVGDIITYTLTIENKGKAEGTVTIKDPVSQDVDLVAGSIVVKGSRGEVEPAPEKAYDADSLRDGITVEVAPNETKTLEFKVKVKDLEDLTKVKNQGTYTVTGPNYDPDNPTPPQDPDPEEEHETEIVEDEYKEPKITTEKSSTIKSGEEYAVVGDIITYTITVTNEGNLGTTVKVKDTIPTGTVFVPNSIAVNVNEAPQEGEYDEHKLEEGISIEVPALGTATVEFKVKVTESNGDLTNGQMIKNEATIEESVPNTETPKIHKPSVEDEYKEANIKSDKKAEIQLQDGDTRNAVIEGDTITYTITLTNDGGIDGEAIVKDTIPTGTKLVDGTIKLLDENGSEVTKEGGMPYTQEELAEGIKVNVKAGKTAKVTFNVTVELGEQKAETVKFIKNVAEVEPQPHKPDPTTPEPEEPEPEEPKPTPQKPEVKLPLIHFSKTAVVTKKGEGYDNEKMAMLDDEITYTITVTNDGDEKVTNIVVKDIIPEGTTYKSVENNGKYDNDTNTVTWTIDELKPAGEEGSSTTVSFVVTVTSNPEDGIIRNSATVGGKPTNETEITYVEPNIHGEKTAKIELEADEDRDYVLEGDTITYTITVKNDGNIKGTATITDEIPTGTNFVENSIKVIGNDGQEIPKDGDPYTEDDLNKGITLTIGPNETKKIEFKVTVLPLGEEGSREIKNTAHIEDNNKKDPPDDPDDNPSTDPIPQYSSELQVRKTNTPSTAVKVGDTITYTILLDNREGTAPATTTVIDQAPEGTVFVKDSIHVYVDNTEEQQDPVKTEENLKQGIEVTVPANKQAKVTFQVKVTEQSKDLKNGDMITNIATVNETRPHEDEPKVHNPKVENKYIEADITAVKESTIVGKDKVTREYAVEGDTITYTITLTNKGDLDGTATVKDTIPAGTSFVNGSIKIGEDEKTEYDQHSLEQGIKVPVSAGKTVKVTFKVTVDKLTEEVKTIKNKATVVTDKPNIEDPGPKPEPEPDPKETEEVKDPIVTFNKSAEITKKTQKDIKEGFVTIGDEITYTITITNNGEVSAKNVVVKDHVPENTEFKEADNSGVHSEDTDEITWQFAEIAPGETKTVTFTVTVETAPEDGKIENTATVGGEPTNETETKYAYPDISAKKSAKINLPDGESRNYVVAGDTITYTITVKNEGDIEGTATVTDTMPDGVEVIAETIKVNGSNKKSDESYYTADDLKNGIEITVLTNKEVTIEFKVKVLPLEDAESRQIKNIAHIEDHNDKDPDPDPDDNPETEPIPQYAPDLQVSKTNSPKTNVTVGDEITYTIILDNSTGTAPTTVKVKDHAPNGTTFVKGSIKVIGPGEVVDEKTYEETQLNEGIEITIDAKTIKKLEFKVKVNDLTNGETITNAATIVDVPQPGVEPPEEPDEKPTNTVTNNYVEADIKVDKTATTEFDRDYVIEGEKITYTIQATNDGDLKQTITIKDNLPQGTSFVEGSIHIYGAGDIEIHQEGQTYILDDLQKGIDVEVEARSTAKLVFQVEVLPLGDNQTNVMIRNIAAYKEKNPENPDPEEKTTKEVETPVMKYEKTVTIDRKNEQNIAPNAVTAGDVIKYTITVKNVSEVTATNINIKDKIPDGTTIKQVYDNGNVNDQKEVVWKIESIEAGQSASVSFDVTVNYQAKDSIIKNIAFVDDQPTNETTTEYKKPEPTIDQTITKSGDEKVTDPNAKIMYNINYSATIKDFKGKAKITIVDTLPFPIDEIESEYDNGKYSADGDKYTITWEEIVDVDTYAEETNEKVITRQKNLNLKYNYPGGEKLSGDIENDVTVVVDLIQKQKDIQDDPEEPDKDVVVKTTEPERDDHVVHVEVPGRVVVHHYIWDKDLDQETTDRLVPDDILDGNIGDPYTTKPSEEVDPNYECLNPSPEVDQHTGQYEKEQKEVVYYYRLKDPTLENQVTKTAEATTQEEREYEVGRNEEDGTPITEKKTVQVLTDENGVVKYHIEQKVRIDEYKGRVTITITDTLPAEISPESINPEKLANGDYDPESRTITWTEEREIDTFTDGAYTETLKKDIEIVYVGQNKIDPLVNIVTAKVTLYNPEVHQPNPNEERKTDEQTTTAEVEQKYTVDQVVQKVWDDGENRKSRRPSSVTVELTADNVPTTKKQILDESNGWKATFEDLDKYNALGNEIVYGIIETETTLGDLAFYEPATVTGKNPLVVTNRYRMMNVNVDSNVDKIGPEVIKSSKDAVDYDINYTATLTDYRGDAKLTIVDYLPYKIDASKSTLNDGDYIGHYDENTQTITWEIPLNNINTYATGNSVITVNIHIKLVYINMDVKANVISNTVNAKLDLYETDSTNTVTDTENTPLDLHGKLIVHYKDKKTGEELTHEVDGVEQEYKYEEEGKVGDPYATRREEIPDYMFDSVEGNEFGTFEDGTIEVTYYYVSDKTPGIDVKWVDEDGNDLATPEHIPGEGQTAKVGDPYITYPKVFEDYELDYVEGEPEGTLTEEGGEVVYHYKKRVGRVIVQYLEKGTEEELLPEKVEEYPVGDNYTTERENIPNYRRADPEPDNKNGIVTKEDTYVKYYYERIPGGKVVTKHVDVDTGEEILYPDEETGEYKSYREEQTGNVGDPYTTDPLDIPYYDLVEDLLPTNQDGFFGEEEKEVIYFYRKQTFNFKVDKVITKATINGEEQKVLDGKLIKVEIVGSEMEDTEVEITYKIRVTNTGEIAGTTTVVEKLPKHFTIGKEAYDEWTENKNGDLEAEVSLEPGETKEFTIKLTWKRGSANFGREINTAEIKDFNNDAHYEDNDEKDNTSEAEVVMGVKTGEPYNIFFIIYVLIILVATAEVIIYARKHKNELK